MPYQMVGRPKSQAATSHRGDVRAQSLTAALRLFAAHGFDGTSVQMVADAVGVAKPSLLHHFPSKEALRSAVLRQMMEHWTELLPKLLLAASAAEGRFEAVTEALVSFFLDDPDRARMLIREALDRPKETRDLLTRYVKPWTTSIATYVRKGQEHAEHFPDVDADAYVVCVLQLVIVAVASERTLNALLPEGRSDSARSRIIGEALRISRASLFLGAPR